MGCVVTLDAAGYYRTTRNEDGTVVSRSRINFGRIRPAEASRPVAFNWVEEAAASDSEVKKNLAFYFKAYFSGANVSLKDNLKDNFDCSAAVRETLFNHAAYVKTVTNSKNMTAVTDFLCDELEEEQTRKSLEDVVNYKNETILKLNNVAWLDYPYTGGNTVFCDVVYGLFKEQFEKIDEFIEDNEEAALDNDC